MRNVNITSRRTFLRQAGTVAAAPYIISATALGVAGVPPPSDRITLGFIGVGMMGQGHHRRFLRHPETQVVGVCDVDTWRRETAQAATHEAYAAERRSGTYQGCAAYNDLRELLARDDLDAVVIATGDRWHGAASVLAAEAGKDIYCEKPMSLTIAEARAMVNAVRTYGRVFQTGLQQRSAHEFRLACGLAREGALGKISHVYIHFPGTSTEVNLPAEPVPEGLDWDLWLGPAPWRPFNSRFHIYGKPPRVVPWDFCRDFGGRNLTSNAVHAFDMVQWGLGMDGSGPIEIIPPETGLVPDLTYKYAGGEILQVVDRRLISATSPDELAAVKEALQTSCIRLADSETCARKIVACLPKTSGELRHSLYDLLGIVGGTTALEAMAKASAEADPELQDTVTRVLGQWMSPDAAPVLLEIASQSDQEKFRVRARRGYIRIVRQFDVPNAQRVAMCRQAMPLAERKEEKLLVLETLPRIPRAESLSIAVSQLEFTEVKHQAALVTLALSDTVVNHDPAAVVAAMEQLLKLPQNADVQNRAQAMLARCRPNRTAREPNRNDRYSGCSQGPRFVRKSLGTDSRRGAEFAKMRKTSLLRGLCASA